MREVCGVIYTPQYYNNMPHSWLTAMPWRSFDNTALLKGTQYRSFCFWLGIDGDVDAV